MGYWLIIWVAIQKFKMKKQTSISPATQSIKRFKHFIDSSNWLITLIFDHNSRYQMQTDTVQWAKPINFYEKSEEKIKNLYSFNDSVYAVVHEYIRLISHNYKNLYSKTEKKEFKKIRKEEERKNNGLKPNRERISFSVWSDRPPQPKNNGSGCLMRRSLSNDTVVTRTNEPFNNFVHSIIKHKRAWFSTPHRIEYTNSRRLLVRLLSFESFNHHIYGSFFGY